MPCIWCYWWPLECVHRRWMSCLLEWEEKTLHRPLGPDLMPGEPHQQNLGWLSSTALHMALWSEGHAVTRDVF